MPDFPIWKCTQGQRRDGLVAKGSSRGQQGEEMPSEGSPGRGMARGQGCLPRMGASWEACRQDTVPEPGVCPDSEGMNLDLPGTPERNQGTNHFRVHEQASEGVAQQPLCSRKAPALSIPVHHAASQLGICLKTMDAVVRIQHCPIPRSSGKHNTPLSGITNHFWELVIKVPGSARP